MTRSLSTTPAAAARTWGRGVSGLALATALFATALPAQHPATPPVAAAPAAQQPANPPATSGSDVGITTIRRNVNEVNLIFTVTDKHGRYVPNLQLHDFALLDDQKAPEKVNSFHQQINLPLRVGILIDTSTSIHS